MNQEQESLMPFRIAKGSSLRTLMLQIATVLVALGVFAADALTSPDQVFSGFYVLILVKSAGFCRRRDLWIVAGLCAVLTLLAQVMSNPLAHDTGQTAI